MTEWSLKDAKNRFGEVVAAAHDTPQLVTNDGKPAVVVVDADQFKQMAGSLPPKKIYKDGKEYTFIDHLLAFPKGGPDDLFDSPRRPKRRDIEL